MRTTIVVLVALHLVASSDAAAQRRFRLGVTGTSLSLEDLTGKSHGFTSVGGSVAFITGDADESGFTISRYGNLSTDGSVRRMTLYAFDSYYYPVGARGVAPFAATEIGLARVAESAPLCPLLCADTLSESNELALAFGLGVRINVAGVGVGMFEGRFLEVPGSAIQALEARASASIAFGKPRQGEMLAGTVGPAFGVLIPVSGPLHARGPVGGVRFRRDTKKAGVLGLEIDYAPLQVTGSCTPPGCTPNAILFAPGYEPSLRPPWGRVYLTLGALLAGVYSEGPDRGIAQGAQAGAGMDIVSRALLWNVNGRVLWLARNGGENVFFVQVGASVSPRLKTR